MQGHHAALAAATLVFAVLASDATAQTTTPTPRASRMADHPAVAEQRLWKLQGYDWASHFYPHPAGLYLRASADPVDDALPAPGAGRLARVPDAPPQADKAPAP